MKDTDLYSRILGQDQNKFVTYGFFALDFAKTVGLYEQ